ncbi:MAG: SsrA-binding protein SmpB [Patescibacteria group bacterium]|nr:SsrA-binding protein SmpB [Patescibacteria group bacterium]
MNIQNTKALLEYTIQETLEAGIVLSGQEVKSLRGGHGNLDGSFVKIIGSEAYLMGAQIYPYSFARVEGYDPRRTRKLLLHKKEILRLKQKLDAGGLTIVPLRWYTIGQNIKLEIGIAKGKKQYEKRDILKKRDIQRELERQFRGKVK